jgi:UDP-N-acetylglucosamine--N-acetylmuramyl-(pentapeptide) pyrophosphoryl-undecaprenol N-acetylglucosamine transferase
MRTIVLTGGGTIGHSAPHFAIIPYLNFDKIYYIGSKTGIEKNFVLSKGLDYFDIEPCKLKRSLSFSNLKIPFTFKKSVNDARDILKKLNPSVVFSKGGYVGLPVTVASKKLDIPVIIHESDLTLGLANKIASKFATKTLTSFEKTAYSVKNGEYVGSPIREELFSKSKTEALNYYNISSDKPVLLVTGGSSGARAINKLVLSALPKLIKYFTVLHVVGKGNLSNK